MIESASLRHLSFVPALEFSSHPCVLAIIVFAKLHESWFFWLSEWSEYASPWRVRIVCKGILDSWVAWIFECYEHMTRWRKSWRLPWSFLVPWSEYTPGISRSAFMPKLSFFFSYIVSIYALIDMLLRNILRTKIMHLLNKIEFFGCELYTLLNCIPT